MTIRTTSKLEAALLLGNGCRLVQQDCDVDSSGIVVMVLDVPEEKHDVAASIRALCPPAVGKAMKDITDLIHRKTGASR
jgi:hypothetical protein